MRRLIKNITDSNLRKELELIWDRLNFIETKSAEPSTADLAPGEAAIYAGNLYINDRNTIRQFDIEGGDASYLKADGSVDLTGNMDVDAGVTIDGVDISAHASRHESGGADDIKLDDLAAPDDNVDLNASTSKHGLLKKLDNVATHYLDGQGNWSALQNHDHTGDAGDGGQLDHGLALTGLTDDDHTQYLKEKASGGAASEVPTHTHQDADNCGQLDHGLALTGLTDDDHTQYLNTTRHDADDHDVALSTVVCHNDEVICHNDEVIFL